MKKRYEGTFIGYYTFPGIIILYNTRDENAEDIGEVYLPTHYAPHLTGKLMYGDKIEFYCDEIQDMIVKSAVDVKLIETRKLK